ncbi:MAG: 3-hydroxybutyryl-CoA dehydrogenase [Rhodomicrobium sp.]|nr:MAG: 3-hydroxybutyryl-CoA dehydrogenase [Rhodomicrobium sp.]
MSESKDGEVTIKEVGVIGAGHMGSGIAQAVAIAGYNVILVDVDEERTQAALATINGNMARQVSRSTITEDDMNEAIGRITITTEIDSLKIADIVVEAATEDEDIKQAIYTDVCPIMKPGAILASNTSTISITRLAAKTDRPDKFIGMHFMNPVPVMELVELIRGIATEDATYHTAKDFVKTLHKYTAVSEDFPAFIVHRIMIPMINEAIYTLYEGVGTVEAIDTAMCYGAHHPMGPLELADFIGLDVCLGIMQKLYEGLADPKYRPCPLLVKYVEAGWVGQKAGRGFYDYRDGTPVPTR